MRNISDQSVISSRPKKRLLTKNQTNLIGPKMTQTYFDATCAYFITEMPNYDCKKRENKKKIYNLKEDVHNQCLT